MSEEKKNVELKDEELEQVSGGYSYNMPSTGQFKCPQCGNRDRHTMSADTYKRQRVQCEICWHEGPIGEFRYNEGQGIPL